MEAYVFISLLGLGYLATKSNTSTKMKDAYLPRTASSNSPQTSQYHTTYTETVRQDDDAKFKKRYDESLKKDPSVISKNYRDQQQYKHEASLENAQKTPTTFESLLSGERMPIEKFTHNNMEPFFGSYIKQNTVADTNEHMLERHTGVSKLYAQEKDENLCFADIIPKKKLDEFGTNDSYQEEYERMVKSMKRTNELPFEQTKVGPGLNNQSQRGFQPDDREHIRAKTIDDLRVKSNQQQTYEGVVIPGTKGVKREAMPSLSKNRVETFHENSPDSLFKTTGAYKKSKHRSSPIVKPTNRQDNSMYITGNIYRNMGNEQSSKLQPTHKKILDDFGRRNVNQEKNTSGDWDYGKNNILVFNNERDITSMRTYEGNITSLIKSIVAPIQDVLKSTNKEFTLMNDKREFGELQSATMPSKPTVYDPSDTTRTTMKETFIHDTRTGNIMSINKNVVYDPDEIMKTTLKETLPSYDNVINMATALKKQTIYDPSDVAKTTIKETTENNYHAGHLDTLEGDGAYKNIDVHAPKTGKQFLSSLEYMGTGPSRGEHDGYLTKDINLETTSKEIISNNDYYGMANSSDKKQKSYDDIYNATINQAKEILLKKREPTQTSVKVTQGMDDLNVLLKKAECERNKQMIGDVMQVEKVYDTPQSKETISLTTVKKQDHSSKESVIDPSILDAFHQNPYTKPLTDAA